MNATKPPTEKDVKDLREDNVLTRKEVARAIAAAEHAVAELKKISEATIRQDVEIDIAADVRRASKHREECSSMQSSARSALVSLAVASGIVADLV